MFKFLLSALALAGDVEVLTDDNIAQFLKDNPKVLVKFYAPWCGHCKSMAPAYEEAATELKGKVPLGDVDATEQKKAASDYGVSGYPTIKWFVNGEASDYSGGRTKDQIVEWVLGMTAPAVSTEVKEPTTKPAVILKSKTLNDVFSNFADANRQKAAFYHVDDGADEITIQHQGEAVQTLKDLTKDGLESFFQKYRSPLVGELNGDTYGDYVAGDAGLIWCLWKHDEGALQKAKSDNFDTMLKLAQSDAVLGKYSVTYTDTVQFKQAVEGMLGVTEFPAVVVQKKAGGKQKFVFDSDKEINADNLIAFVKDINDGKITAKLKSEAKPETQDDVKVVVGDTLMEMVFDAKKDVLLEVYAPWCGHCKSLEPEYNRVAKKVVAEIDDLVTIAKMDGTANDSPTDDIDWSGFPTIKFVKAGSKVVSPYEGGRTAKDIWSWIRENSSHKEEITKRLSAKYEAAEKHDEL